ncbi:MAG: response regulator [Gammaproteobacteria bacterium]|nr:response regulator [Gammaproteobacteria bacterium]
MNIDPVLMRQLVETFRIELNERLEVISQGLMALEQQGDATTRDETLNVMFRACHNIKGAARGLGLMLVADLAHQLESLFTTLRQQKIAVSPAVADLSLATLDMLSLLIQDERVGEGDDNPLQPPLAQLRLQLQQAIAGELPATLPEEKPAAPEEHSLEETGSKHAVAGSDSVRLPVERLNRIAALADELQLMRIRIDQHRFRCSRMNEQIASLKKQWKRVMDSDSATFAGGESRHALADATHLLLEVDQMARSLEQSLYLSSSQMRPLAAHLKGDVRSLRMVPAATILVPLERSVRDIAQKLHKTVKLQLIGGDLEVDRVVLDGLRDPLMHLLRNAVDHGIESPEVRQGAGKGATGVITITLSRDGGTVQLLVEDDGGGIDIAKIRQRLVEHGFASLEEVAQMEEPQLLDYIFRPGFSSRREVSDISGRGVGLDVVRINMQALQGQIEISTRLGQGTRFTLNVPISMASEHGVMVRCSGQRFVLYSQYIDRILEVPQETVRIVEGQRVIHIQGQPLPLYGLATLLNLDTQTGADPYHGDYLQVVVVVFGWQRVALIVEALLTERDIVTRPLSAPLQRMPQYEGGVIGSDGRVVLVLNISHLLQIIERQRGQRQSVPAQLVKREAEKGATILVVDDSVTTRTLEKGILENNGYRVQTANSAEEGLDWLAQIKIDLVISDVEMPGMNGFEFTDTIRRKLGMVDLPVIIVSSLGSDADRARGLAVKANAYIVKGKFDSRELLEIVEQLL